MSTFIWFYSHKYDDFENKNKNELIYFFIYDRIVKKGRDIDEKI